MEAKKGLDQLRELGKELRREEKKRVKTLIDLIVKLAFEEAAPEIKTLVGHRFPGDDVWLCCWMAKKFLPKAANAEIVFVNAGESLPGSDGDPSVLHFDTGGGEYVTNMARDFEKPAAQLFWHKNLGFPTIPV